MIGKGTTMKVSEALAKILVTPALRRTTDSICTIMWHVLDVEDFDITLPMLEGWAMWAGSTAFPVPGARFYDAQKAGNMWRGEYGRNRRSLLRHLIQWHRERGL